MTLRSRDRLSLFATFSCNEVPVLMRGIQVGSTRQRHQSTQTGFRNQMQASLSTLLAVSYTHLRAHETEADL
eukprot:249493-Rhodomonas_salina.1